MSAQIVKVRYFSETTQELSPREYTYYSEETLKVGDIVTVPVRDTTCKAQVSVVGVPETDIAAFKDKVKTIPAGSVVQPTIPEAKPGDDWKTIKPLGPLTDTRTESKIKKNPDYSLSAINLCNPPELQELMAQLFEAKGNASEIKDRIDDSIPPALIKASEQIQERIDTLNADIRTAIDKYGSYQDAVNGFYAIKQRRETVMYKPDLVRKTLPPGYHGLVIEEAVNTRALEGLIKGGLVTPDLARQCGEVKESFAYIVK